MVWPAAGPNYSESCPLSSLEVSNISTPTQYLTVNNTMNNKTFKYFDWGSHNDQDKKFYALTDSDAKKFYLVGQCYKLLRQIQLLTMSSQHLILLDLSLVKGYSLGLLDNSVCLNWGLHSPVGAEMITGWGLNYSPGIFSKLVNHCDTVNESELEFQKNLLFLVNVLNKIDAFIDQEYTKYDLNGYQELIEFFKITMPQDQLIIDTMCIEKNIKENVIEYRNNVIRHLSNINYVKTHNEVIKQSEFNFPFYNNGHDLIDFEFLQK